jgi:integrase
VLLALQYTHAVLHRALKQEALRWNLVPRNVTEAVDPPRLVKKEVQHLTLEQATAFLKVVSEDRFEALYVLAISTGLRRGELLGLKWVDVDLDRGVLSVQRALSPKGKTFHRPKNAKGRSIQLNICRCGGLKEGPSFSGRGALAVGRPLAGAGIDIPLSGRHADEPQQLHQPLIQTAA